MSCLLHDLHRGHTSPESSRHSPVVVNVSDTNKLLLRSSYVRTSESPDPRYLFDVLTQNKPNESPSHTLTQHIALQNSHCVLSVTRFTVLAPTLRHPVQSVNTLLENAAGTVGSFSGDRIERCKSGAETLWVSLLSAPAVRGGGLLSVVIESAGFLRVALFHVVTLNAALVTPAREVEGSWTEFMTHRFKKLSAKCSLTLAVVVI